MLRSKKLRIPGCQWFFFFYSSFSLLFVLSFLFLYTSVSSVISWRSAGAKWRIMLYSIRGLLRHAMSHVNMNMDQSFRRSYTRRLCNIKWISAKRGKRNASDSSFELVSGAISGEHRRPHELLRNGRNLGPVIFANFAWLISSLSFLPSFLFSTYAYTNTIQRAPT